MQGLPDTVLQAWAKRDPACVLTTVSADGTPNTIYVSCCELVDTCRILICNSAFSKTLENLEAGRDQASFLFFAPDIAAFQLKGKVSHHTSGVVFEEGKGFAKMPESELRGVAMIEIAEAYQGATRLL